MDCKLLVVDYLRQDNGTRSTATISEWRNFWVSYVIQRHIVSSDFGDLNSRSVVVVKGGGLFHSYNFLLADTKNIVIWRAQCKKQWL